MKNTDNAPRLIPQGGKMPDTETTQSEKFYKVLDANGHSCHGGELEWSLPNGRPGKWHEISESIALSMCSVGLHLTREPVQWLGAGHRVFKAECGDEILREDGSDEVCVRRARLLHECDEAELASLRIFRAGRHEISEGFAWVSGSATIVLHGSSRAELYGSSHAEMHGSSSAVLWESSSAESRERSTLFSYDARAKFTLHGSMAVCVKR